MVDVWLPYGKTEICVRVPTRNLLGSIDPKDRASVPDGKAEVARAIREPIGSRRLGEIVKPESRVAIVIDDATRPSPSHLIIPPLLDELTAAGAKDENFTIIFGCGTHRAVKREEAAQILGEDVLGRVKTISHDCNSQDLVHIGTTQKHGTKVSLNRIFVEADVRILTGDVCLHYFAGYGGGRKSVLPAIAGEDTIRHNHAMALDVNAKVGVLEGNPVNEDMIEAAKMARVDFTVNVVTNSKGEIVKAFAGDLDQTFLEGVKLVDEMYRVTVNRKADIVVVSSGGNPADLNLYQAYKGVDNALEVVTRGGVIVLVAECPEGHGNQAFHDWMVKFSDLKTIEREIKKNFVLGGHKAYYLLRALQNHMIIMVSSMPDYYASNIFKLKTARAVNDALNEAFNIAGRNAKIWVIPLGNYTLPQVNETENTNVHEVVQEQKSV